MRRPPSPRRARPAFRPDLDGGRLEGRALLAGLPPGLNLGGLIGQLPPGSLSQIPGVRGATPDQMRQILEAIQAGAANEWLQVVMRNVPNPMGILNGFMAGTRSEYSTRGVAFQLGRYAPGYTGVRQDGMEALMAGAVATGRQRLLLGALVDGEIPDMGRAQLVFGIDRGGPKRPVAGRAETMVDALVVVRLDAGRVVSAQVRDLAANRVTNLPASGVKVMGATLQVTLDPKLLPSRGLNLGQYRFSFWTVDDRGGQIASYLPGGKTVPIAVGNASLANLRPA
jgi:hypothetical protein